MAGRTLQRKVKALTDSNLIDSGSPFFWHPKMFKALPINNLILHPGGSKQQFIGGCKKVAISAHYTPHSTLYKTTSPRHITGVKWMSNRKGEIRFHIEMIVPGPFDFDGDSHMDLVVGDEDGLLGSPANYIPVHRSRGRRLRAVRKDYSESRKESLVE